MPGRARASGVTQHQQSVITSCALELQHRQAALGRPGISLDEEPSRTGGDSGVCSSNALGEADIALPLGRGWRGGLGGRTLLWHAAPSYPLAHV